MAGFARKHHLPNYNVFDEPRVFRAGPIAGPFRDRAAAHRARRSARTAWYPDVAEAMAESGARDPDGAERLAVPPRQVRRADAPHGEPGGRDRAAARLPQHGRRAGRPGVRRRLVRAQPGRRAGGAAAGVRRGDRAVDFEEGPQGWRALRRAARRRIPEPIEQAYRAMVVALGDYLRKTGFAKVLLGLSGGVDSALVAAVAVDALGPENVRCVMLPSEFTSAREPRGRRRGGGRARLPARRAVDRAGPRRGHRRRWRRSSPGGPRT